MKVILKTDVKKVGKKGDIVEVSDGYGRNYLIARGLAVASTEKSREILAEQKQAEKEMNVSIDDEMKTKMVSLMKKIGGLDLDLGKIQNQAQNVYDKIKDMGIDLDDAKGIWAKICDFFVMIGKAIADFFSNLF